MPRDAHLLSMLEKDLGQDCVCDQALILFIFWRGEIFSNII